MNLLSGVVRPHGLDPETFCAQIWQQKPALFRQAFPEIQSPLTPEELAGIALEDMAESRLVRFDPERKNWAVRHGPFQASDFTSLPDQHWTLLVQQMEHWMPALGELQKAFDFLPRWRMDDVMVSYAVPGGSVGAHVDQYDVFLLQLSGRREWSIARDFNSDIRPDQDQAVLADFKPEQSWVLEAGDILYLPPGVAHHGIALDDPAPCLTASIGFRAPALSDFIHEWGHQLTARESGQRFADPGRSPARDPAKLTHADRQRFRKWFEDASQLDDQEFSRLLGCLLTRPTRERWNEFEPADLSVAGGQYIVEPDSDLRWAWSESPDKSSDAELFCEGQSYPLPADLARALANGEIIELDGSDVPAPAKTVIQSLLHEGHVSITEKK